MMQRGCSGADVLSWQRFLFSQGHTLSPDGVFGPATQAATMLFQKTWGLQADGIVGGRTLQAASALGFAVAAESVVSDVGSYSFLPARNFTVSSRTRIDLIVIHTMEAPQSAGRALQVAKWFSDPKNAPQASAHFCVDASQVIRSVHDKDVAWHAPGANARSIGIEHAGYADKTDWSSSYSLAMLTLSQKLVAQLCRAYGIPAVWLTPERLRASERGICGHADCTHAFSGGRGHVDPGLSFPKQEFVSGVVTILGGAG